ncbi:MAG: lysophospholipase [Planctomycetota bacterium]|nr:lysophospholipase [Planctomycetota bacterium]
MGEWVWWLSAFVAAFLVVELAVRFLVLSLVLPIFERRPPFNVQSVDPHPDAEPLRIPTTDGLTLAGSLYRPHGEPRGLIVFCPEFCGSHWSAPVYAGGLLDAGFALLAFDFRNQGQSDREPGYTPTHWLTEREMDDTLAVLHFAANRHDLRELPVGMFGISRGGNAALLAAARCKHVQVVAADGAFSTEGMMLHYAYRWAELYVPRGLLRLVPEWHLVEMMRFARRVSGFRHGVRYSLLERWLPRLAGRPVLLISGERDSYVAPPIADRLRRRIGPSCEPVWFVPGAKHNQARDVATEEYDARLRDFFEQIVPVHLQAQDSRRLAPIGR